MKPKVMLACLGLLAFAAPVWAQQKVKEKPREEVVIKKGGSGKEKTVIVIEGDRVTVNGKPLAEYGGDDVIIHKRALERLADGQVEYRREMELAQREMQRVQREMQRSVLEMGRSRAPLYRYSYPNDIRVEFDFDGADVRSEPKAFLGVGLEDADKGVKITNVTEGSAAAKAGLKEGDVITKFGGTSVKTAEALTEQVRAKKPNDEVELAYIKAGEKKERKVKVKLGESKSLVRVYSSSGQTPRAPRPPRPPMSPRDPMAPLPPIAPLEEIDMIWAPDAPAMPRAFSSTEGFSWSYNGRQLGLRVQETDDSVGVKVLDVTEGSLAATAGVKENDIVTSIDGKTIKSTRDCADAMRDARDKNNYMIRLLRGGSPMTLEVKIPKKLKKADF
jgi:serine protease Do